jgi:hypothetical protein
MRLQKNLGMLFLAVWLIAFGVLTATFLKFSFAHTADLLAVLPLVAFASRCSSPAVMPA